MNQDKRFKCNVHEHTSCDKNKILVFVNEFDILNDVNVFFLADYNSYGQAASQQGYGKTVYYCSSL